MKSTMVSPRSRAGARGRTFARRGRTGPSSTENCPGTDGWETTESLLTRRAMSAVDSDVWAIQQAAQVANHAKLAIRLSAVTDE